MVHKVVNSLHVLGSVWLEPPVSIPIETAVPRDCEIFRRYKSDDFLFRNEMLLREAPQSRTMKLLHTITVDLILLLGAID